MRLKHSQSRGPLCISILESDGAWSYAPLARDPVLHRASFGPYDKRYEWHRTYVSSSLIKAWLRRYKSDHGYQGNALLGPMPLSLRSDL
jgi:hypothetical protein